MAPTALSWKGSRRNQLLILAPVQRPGVLKPILQLLVCVTIGLRCLALFDQLRRAWIADGLAAEFRRELRRRGLLVVTPSPRAD
jgi:hypothetical protein